MGKKDEFEIEEFDDLEFKEYHKNPRIITDKQFGHLQQNLKELGDLSGILHDLNSDEFIGGNQRSKAIDIDKCRIVLVKKYKKPTKTGTVAVGFIEWEGELFNYRQVRWTKEQCEQANITANKLGGKWDFDILANEFEFEDLLEFGFEEWELTGTNTDPSGDGGDPSGSGSITAEQDEYDYDLNKINTDIVEGDLIEILTNDGRKHRIFCGDSTHKEDVSKLFDGSTCTMIHADPPYGMGKHSEGVENDNIYREELDAFHLLWISAFLENMIENGSLYIWGNPQDLWRLWYLSGLSKIDNLHFINQIIWAKIYSDDNPSPHAIGNSSYFMRSYPAASEHCLFIMRGPKEMQNNSEDYWEGWEPIRTYLVAEAKKMRWKAKKIHDLCGLQMYSHWFTKSQFTLIPQQHYETLQEAAKGKAFKVSYDKLGEGINNIKAKYEEYKQAFYDSRAYFDNGHSKQTDVWMYPRVMGNDRPDHATPKPIATAERAIKSSSRVGDVVAEPFLGSGTTLLAAHQIGRTLYAMELQPKYVAMSIDRLLKIDDSLQLFRNGEPYELKI